MTKQEYKAAMLTEAAKCLDSYAKSGIDGYRVKANDRLREAGRDERIGEGRYGDARMLFWAIQAGFVSDDADIVVQ